MATLQDEVTINGMRLRNRVALPPLTTNYGSPEGLVTDDILQFYRERSKDVGLVIVEAASVRDDGRILSGSLGLWEKGQVTGMARLADTIKKSGWRRLARAFTLSTAILDRTIERDDDMRVVSAEFIVRASHPNGAYADGWGGADKFERRFNKDQDIIATAQTRATNRAISDLIAGGEVSADEIGEDGQIYQKDTHTPTPRFV